MTGRLTSLACNAESPYSLPAVLSGGKGGT